MSVYITVSSMNRVFAPKCASCNQPILPAQVSTSTRSCQSRFEQNQRPLVHTSAQASDSQSYKTFKTFSEA